MKFVIPVPPSLNNLYITNSRGGRYMVESGRAWKKDAIYRIHEQATQADWSVPKDARLCLTLSLWFIVPRRTDISNRVKIVEDALATALNFDDTTVDLLIVRRAGYDKANARCEIDLRVLEVTP